MTKAEEVRAHAARLLGETALQMSAPSIDPEHRATASENAVPAVAHTALEIESTLEAKAAKWRISKQETTRYEGKMLTRLITSGAIADDSDLARALTALVRAVPRTADDVLVPYVTLARPGMSVEVAT